MKCDVEKFRVRILVLCEHFCLDYVLEPEYFARLIVLQLLHILNQQHPGTISPVRQLTPYGPINPMNNLLQVGQTWYAIRIKKRLRGLTLRNPIQTLLPDGFYLVFWLIIAFPLKFRLVHPATGIFIVGLFTDLFIHEWANSIGKAGLFTINLNLHAMLHLIVTRHVLFLIE